MITTITLSVCKKCDSFGANALLCSETRQLLRVLGNETGTERGREGSPRKTITNNKS